MSARPWPGCIALMAVCLAIDAAAVLGVAWLLGAVFGP